MNRNKDLINYHQLFFLLIHTQLGVGGLSLPYAMYQAAKTDGWISMLIAGLVLQGLLISYLFLFKRFPEKNILEIAEMMLGRKIGKLISLLYSLYFLSVGSLIVVLFNHIIDNWILPYTPNWVVGFLLVGTGIMLCTDGLRILARFYVLVTPLIAVLVFLIAYTLRDATFYYLLPIGQTGLKEILFGSKDAILSMLGFEVVLLVFPLASGTFRQKFKMVTFANLFITLLYTFLIIISFIYFSPDEIQIVPEPLLFILKSYTFKIIERTDLLFLSLWIFLVFTSFSSYLFLSAESSSKFFKNKPRNKLVYYIAILMFGGSLIPEMDIKYKDLMSTYITNASIFFILLPVLFLLLSFILKKSAPRSESIEQNR